MENLGFHYFTPSNANNDLRITRW